MTDNAPLPSSRSSVRVPTRSGLLVSVRSSDEAEIALEAGADLIDIKDPTRGSLGMAHHETVARVLEVVNGRVPVSAALGEFAPDILTRAHWHLELPLDYIKWGLANYLPSPGWGEDLLETRRELPARIEVVACAYADWERANSVPPAEVAKFAKRYRYKAFLLDTAIKDGQTLVDLMPVAEIRAIVESLQKSNIMVVLAGSLKPESLSALTGITPHHFAVRSSVATGGKREALLDAGRIRKWKDLLSSR